MPNLRTVTISIGTLFTLQGIGWLIAPGLAAQGLGMPMLDGLGRSTQLGDFSAFFLVLGVSILIGTRPGQTGALYFPAALLGSAALCRTIAWAAHGAAFATLFIGVEVISSIVLLVAASRLDSDV